MTKRNAFFKNCTTKFSNNQNPRQKRHHHPMTAVLTYQTNLQKLPKRIVVNPTTERKKRRNPYWPTAVQSQLFCGWEGILGCMITRLWSVPLPMMRAKTDQWFLCSSGTRKKRRGVRQGCGSGEPSTNSTSHLWTLTTGLATYVIFTAVRRSWQGTGSPVAPPSAGDHFAPLASNSNKR